MIHKPWWEPGGDQVVSLIVGIICGVLFATGNWPVAVLVVVVYIMGAMSMSLFVERTEG